MPAALHILFIDDDPNMHRMVSLFLQRENIILEMASNGRHALHKLKSNRYDIIISDLQMPEMDGIALIKKIRFNNILTPILIISAFGKTNLTDEAKKAGASKILSKPIDSKSLISAIHEVAAVLPETVDQQENSRN